MRTTVRLSEELLSRAKKQAALEGTTLTALIERGLRGVLDKPAPSPAARILPPVSNKSGRMLVDTVKTSELLEIGEEDLPIEKRR
jgi:hypothetical protein